MCIRTRETRIALPSTSHRNRELPDILLALASTTVFSVMDGPKNVMQVLLRPAHESALYRLEGGRIGNFYEFFTENFRVRKFLSEELLAAE